MEKYFSQKVSKCKVQKLCWSSETALFGSTFTILSCRIFLSMPDSLIMSVLHLGRLVTSKRQLKSSLNLGFIYWNIFHAWVFLGGFGGLKCNISCVLFTAESMQAAAGAGKTLPKTGFLGGCSAAVCLAAPAKTAKKPCKTLQNTVETLQNTAKTLQNTAEHCRNLAKHSVKTMQNKEKGVITCTLSDPLGSKNH